MGTGQLRGLRFMSLRGPTFVSGLLEALKFLLLPLINKASAVFSRASLSLSLSQLVVRARIFRKKENNRMEKNKTDVGNSCSLLRAKYKYY